MKQVVSVGVQGRCIVGSGTGSFLIEKGLAAVKPEPHAVVPVDDVGAHTGKWLEF